MLGSTFAGSSICPRPSTKKTRNQSVCSRRNGFPTFTLVFLIWLLEAWFLSEARIFYEGQLEDQFRISSTEELVRWFPPLALLAIFVSCLSIIIYDYD